MEMEGVSASNFSVEMFSLVVVGGGWEDEDDDVEDTEVDVVESDTFTKQEGQHSPGIVKLYSPWWH